MTTHVGIYVYLTLPSGMTPEQAVREVKTSVAFGQAEVVLQYVEDGAPPVTVKYVDSELEGMIQRVQQINDNQGGRDVRTQVSSRDTAEQAARSAAG